MITTIDRPALKTIQSTLQDDLVAIAAKLGLTVRIGGISTADGLTASLSIKLTVDKKDEATGLQLDPRVTAWNQRAESFGLDKSWLGREVSVGQRDKAKIVGLEPNRSTPVVVETKRGKKYVVPVTTIVNQLGTPIKVVGLTAEIKAKFVELAAGLSPENLSCDGELPRIKVVARRALLQREWKALEAEAGCKVSEDEAWSFLPTVEPMKLLGRRG